jgi:hypothetical protein
MNVWVSDSLWQEFHAHVNMTPNELENWLQAMSSRESREHSPDQAGLEVGWRIHAILSTPRADLTEEDASVMESVVGRIRLERRHDLHPSGGAEAWRERLMSLGHDPRKSPEDTPRS